MLRALAIVLGLAVAGCGNPDGWFAASAKQTLERYLAAAAKDDWAAAYQQVSAADRAAGDLPAFVADAGKASGIPAGTALVGYRILDVDEAGDRAIARVDLAVQEIGSLLPNLWGHELSPAKGSAGKAAAGTPSDQATDTTRRLAEFALVRERRRWKVLLSGTRAVASEPTETAAAGAQAGDDKPGAVEVPAGAVEGPDTAWSIAGRVLDAHARDIRSGEDARAYLGNVELYELQAGYYRTVLGKRLPGVKFKLRNRGARTLTKVAVTVYFKDAGGTVISEATFYPVLVSGGSFLDSEPLKPNYIWQLERGKFFVADAVPSEWKPGAAVARITDIGLAPETR